MTAVDHSADAPLAAFTPHDRLRAAIDAMVAAGDEITFTGLACRSGLSREAIFKHPGLRAIANDALGLTGSAERPAELSQPADSMVPGELRRLAEFWAADRHLRGQISGRSAYLYLSRVESLVESCGSVERLDRAAIIAWQRSISPLGQASRHAYIGAVGRFLRWLHAEGHVDTDLSAHLGKVRQPRGVPRALPVAEAARVLAACNRQRDRLIVRLMLDCGLRCLEVSRLDIDDYDPDAATILVHGKGGHERVLPVPGATRQAIDLYLAERGYQPGPLVLGVGNKTPLDGRLSEKAVSKRLGEIMARAGVHQPGDGKSAHALRHTAASDVLDRCLDLRVVQQMLGHASLATTERYLRRADLGRLRAAMEGRDYSGQDGTSA